MPHTLYLEKHHHREFTMTDNRCVKSGGYFIPPNSPYLSQIREQYTCVNPAYNQAQALRKSGKWVNIPDEQIYACQTIPLWHTWGGGLMIPRGIDLSQYDFQKINRTSTNTELSSYQFADGIQLRDYQQDAVDEWVKRFRNGLIVAPCGAGKTMMGLGAIVRCNVKTIVLVHTSDLASQWKERICAQLVSDGEVSVTMYGNGKKDASGDVVVASFQTLYRMRFDELLEFGSQFGLCIVDEAHHVPASTFSHVMFGMPAQARLALTATPDRPDGLGDIMYWHFGDAVAQIHTTDLIEKGNVLAPTVKFHCTYWRPEMKKDWPKLVNDMCGSKERNAQILAIVEKMVSDGRQILVLSDRVQHCIDLAEETANRGMSSATLVGKMTKKQREEVLREADDREISALFATTVADEGLDLPGLDTLMLTTPTKSMGKIQQRIGRIMRRAENKKTPIVIDLVDATKPSLYASQRRSRFYEQVGCTVEAIGTSNIL